MNFIHQCMSRNSSERKSNHDVLQGVHDEDTRMCHRSVNAWPGFSLREPPKRSHRRPNHRNRTSHRFDACADSHPRTNSLNPDTHSDSGSDRNSGIGWRKSHYSNPGEHPRHQRISRPSSIRRACDEPVWRNLFDLRDSSRNEQRSETKRNQ